jgi:hypothetical protein
MKPFITINGHVYPHPSQGLEFIDITAVNSARNANNVVVGQVVGRRQQKINNLEWHQLDAETWSKLLLEFDNFYFTCTYPDMVHNRWTTRKMYPGDRTAKPIHVDPATGLPDIYAHCKVNIIDVGEDET